MPLKPPRAKPRRPSEEDRQALPSWMDTHLLEKIRQVRERGPGEEAGDDEGEMPLEAALVCHIFVLNSVLERTGNRLVEAHALTLPQWMALCCLRQAGGDGLTHSELGQRLMLSKAPITGVVDRLERAGLVTRTPSESDRRVSRVRETAAGTQKWREVRGAFHAQAEKHCARLGNEEKEQAIGILSRLLESAAASDPMLAATRGNGKKAST